MNYRRHFIKCYINQVLHFDTTMTSRDEDFHAILKQQLSKFIDDLKTIINDINFMSINKFKIIASRLMTIECVIQ